MPDLRQFIPAPKDIPAASRPDKEMMDEAKEGIPLRSPRRGARKKEIEKKRGGEQDAPRTGRRSTTSKRVPRVVKEKTRSKSVRSKPARSTPKKVRTTQRKKAKAQTRKRAAVKKLTQKRSIKRK
jgi:hypothetical protein